MVCVLKGSQFYLHTPCTSTNRMDHTYLTFYLQVSTTLGLLLSPLLQWRMSELWCVFVGKGELSELFCCIVYWSCAQSCTVRWAVLNSCLDWVLSHWAHFTHFLLLSFQLIISPPFYVKLQYHGKALNSLICADVPLRNCSLTHSNWSLISFSGSKLKRLLIISRLLSSETKCQPHMVPHSRESI